MRRLQTNMGRLQTILRNVKGLVLTLENVMLFGFKKTFLPQRPLSIRELSL